MDLRLVASHEVTVIAQQFLSLKMWWSQDGEFFLKVRCVSVM